jgi:hypothetical protein
MPGRAPKDAKPDILTWMNDKIGLEVSKKYSQRPNR